ncbi:DUF5658 family protein [Acidobacteriota bacterium]
MQKRESAHQTLKIFTIFFCLMISLFFPLSAEEKTDSHTKELSTRPSSYFSLAQLIEKTPYSFEIQPFHLKDEGQDLKSEIQLLPPLKRNRFEQTAYTTSLMTLTALNIADVVTTMQALKYDGLTEGNPVMKPFAHNVYLFTAVKLGVTAFNYYLLKKLHKKNKTVAWVLSMAANLVMSYVVAHNIRMIQDARAR